MPRSAAILCCCLLVSVVVAEDSDNGSAEQVEFFEKKIRPVLVEHCYQCHSTESTALKGNLRLDDAAATRQGGDSGPAVVSGKPDESLLLSAMRYESFEMPPSGRLPENVIADFEKWIEQGAADPRTEIHPSAAKSVGVDLEAGRTFWAFQRPERSAFLASLAADSEPEGSGRIDALVRRKLSEKGIAFNAAADRRTLLRRLSFDLVGLPPSTDLLQRFTAAESAMTVEYVVDELLASQAFGQRWARVWLDVVRYAEDQAHIVGNNKALFYPNAWMYRDWVIDAMNADMPYDRFVRLQLAADLLEPDNAAEQVALGFIGLGPKYYRRSDPEVMADEWEDRIDVVGRGLQGLTVACARCHDHKYDPVSTEDYYALAGVFASTDMFNKPMSADVETDKSGQAKDTEQSLHVVKDGKVQDLAVMIRGKVDNRGDVVPRGFLQVMFDGDRRKFEHGSGRRELAEAITDEKNPLTARVIVNRIWKQYFGRGLVATPSNFGQLGERPSHPELLDDLAVRFMQHGWSLKWLHREIVLSQTYQQSSELTSASVAKDPANTWLWRMPRRRLSVEAWRDAVLFVSGKLDKAATGRSIKPDDPEETRRTIYAEVSRFELNPLLARFDFPDPNVHAARRVETNTPLQKLFLLNNPFMMTQAEHVAQRASSMAEDVEGQVAALFEITLQRPADDAELAAAISFVSNESPDLNLLAQTLIASNEFWFLD